MNLQVLWAHLHWWRYTVENAEDAANGRPLRHPSLPPSPAGMVVGTVPLTRGDGSPMTVEAITSAMTTWQRRAAAMGVGPAAGAVSAGGGKGLLIAGLAGLAFLMFRKRKGRRR